MRWYGHHQSLLTCPEVVFLSVRKSFIKINYRMQLCVSSAYVLTFKHMFKCLPISSDFIWYQCIARDVFYRETPKQVPISLPLSDYKDMTSNQKQTHIAIVDWHAKTVTNMCECLWISKWENCFEKRYVGHFTEIGQCNNTHKS